MEGLETRELKFSTRKRRWLRCRNSKQARRVLGTWEGGASFTAALQGQGPCLALPSDTQEPQSITIAFLSQALYDMARHWQAIVPRSS